MAKTAVSLEPRLKTLYKGELVKTLKKELNLNNVSQVPKLDKVVVSCGTGKHKEDKKYQEIVANTISSITGQMPMGKQAKKSIATFKIRKGLGGPIGYSVTLRGDKMYEFVDRLISVALPHVRDFHGVPLKSFDMSGNYNLGLSEQSIFPELDFEETQILHGLEITFVIKNGSKDGSQLLLKSFGMPFEKGKES
jgi:Ribosomal protein L5